MTAEKLMELVGENVYLVAIALWIVGRFMKGIPKVPDWTIPFVLTGAGIALCMGVMGPQVDAVIQGILCAGGAVLADQMVKQAEKAKDGE